MVQWFKDPVLPRQWLWFHPCQEILHAMGSAKKPKPQTKQKPKNKNKQKNPKTNKQKA